MEKRKEVLNLKDISNELEKYNIESWKLMEFCPLRGDAIENKARLEIPHEIFESTAFLLQKKSNLNIKIFSREKTENQAVIAPSGQSIYSKDDNDIFLPNNILKK